MQAAHDITCKHLGKATVWHKYTHDVKIEHNLYEHGESVWYFHKKRVPGISPKLQPAYVLCVVLKRLNDVNFLIGLEGANQGVVHHNNLKKYEGGKSQLGWKKPFVSIIEQKLNLRSMSGSPKVKVIIRIIQILRACYDFCLSSDDSLYDGDS